MAAAVTLMECRGSSVQTLSVATDALYALAFQVSGVRAANLTRYLPLLALLHLVGVVDGLGQRRSVSVFGQRCSGCTTRRINGHADGECPESADACE
jgi:hypothetical protein